ncbi:MAG TPA: anaerobic ribonucleoside-triphosphate reductase activating protein [Methanothrix sp.]|nr:anaerobic ribonucleoside-triphosphate reductase activating protein [Methanothrix sp.]HOK57917.1 anaerobic ribonucleoside-triphosphate reductase activating protein [Methanothrix sp.]HOL43320.1 anaerobic ribonucleoside-triphosphate reductase activating protein [Methanothrix sp.]HPO88231.1 anaerobic ribonucleoside-triphosphate reductase activating protein [Methanothrix sp.]
MMMVNLGGIVPLSTVDWPGRVSAVIFLRGCPFRCPFCQNAELQSGWTPVDISELMDRLFPRRGAGQSILHEFSKSSRSLLIDSVVLSGGEPLAQREAALAIAREVKARGLDLGVETNGYHPETLEALVSEGCLSRVFLDIKAAPREDAYLRATGIRDALPRVLRSLDVIVENEVPFEIRITVFPGMPSEDELKEISDLLQHVTPRSLESVVLQQGIPPRGEFEPVSEEDLRRLAQSLKFNVRIRSLRRSVP